MPPEKAVYQLYVPTAVAKNPLASAGDTGSIPGSGRSPGNGNPLQYSAWKIPWTEEPDSCSWGCSPWGCRVLDMTECTYTHMHIHTHLTLMESLVCAFC